MRKGRIIAVAIIVVAAASSVGTVLWLKQLQKLAAESASTPCVIPDERSCARDVDCVEVRCPDNCVCGERCGSAISREVLKAEHHVCLVAVMEPRVPRGCDFQNICKCESFPCRKVPRCIASRCEMVGPTDGGGA